MTPLEIEIRTLIAQEGPLSLEHYMGLALGHPLHGYYMTREPFGHNGDFITAPEISQMFGELLGLWAAESWSLAGSPAPVQLIELGPGRGTLMLDALRAGKVLQEFFSTLDVHMIENSPRLTQIQQQGLNDKGLPIHWHKTLESVPEGFSIILANEFFDALPARHYVKTAAGWCERRVGLDEEGNLCFGIFGEPEPTLQNAAPDGAILEIGAISYRVMSEICARLAKTGGAMLVIDYGHMQSNIGETLQAMRAHAFVDPLAEPGRADLTTHVDFSALSRAAQAQGLLVQGPTTQGSFLRDIGIFERAAALRSLATEAQQLRLDQGLARLTQSGKNMGELFKVLAVRHPSLPALPGFGSTFDPLSAGR